MAKIAKKQIFIELGIILIWTFSVISFQLGIVQRENKHARIQALAEARSTHNYDLNFRSWVSSHGGFYVPETEDLNPNPYLKHIVDQNITTPSDKALTLMNPAWAIRNLNEFDQNRKRASSHITSLILIRPENAPDPWENEALLSFETGSREISGLTEIDNEPYFRYMKPLIVQEACLKCHGYQGYAVGDIRGGISVSVPYKPYLEELENNVKNTSYFIMAVYLVGLALILFGARLIRNRNSVILKTKSLLIDSNEELEKEIYHSKLVNEKLKLEITNHKKAENNLSEAYGIIFRSSSVVILWNNDEVMSIDFVSENVSRLTGYSVSELMAKKNLFRNIIHNEDRERVMENLTGIGRVQNSVTIEPFRLICKTGTEKWIDCHSSFRKNETGEITHIEAIITDITSNILNTLEKEKLQVQLNYKTKMDGLGQLAGGVAHDFNNILHGISSAAELMKMKSADPVMQYADLIIQATSRAAGLTERLLDYSRKDKIAFKEVNIHKVIENCKEILQNTLSRKIELIVENKAVKFYVCGNEAGIENALINLVVNAGHAIENDGTIVIGTEDVHFENDFYDDYSFEVKAGLYCKITIRDTGCGIPKNQIKKIFDPFYTTRDLGEGTGLGLTTVYSTVENHRGSLEVSSEVGLGTTFTLSLPIIQEESKRAPSRIEVVSGSGKILFADDEEMNQLLIPELLESLGYEVIVAVNGKDALEKYKSHYPHIDAVILDLMMPVMDGREACARLLEFDENCRILISSGYSNKGDAEDQVKYPVKGYINKPYQINEISRILGEILK